MASLSSSRYLTSDDLEKIFQSTRKSVDYLSEFDDSSTEASTNSSFWESSEAESDSTATDDLSSELSGSDPSELLGLSGPSEPSLGEDSDEALESTPQLYNLRVRKRAVPTELLPSAKRSRLDMEASTSRRGQGNRGGRRKRGGRGGEEQGQKGPVTAKGYHPRGS